MTGRVRHALVVVGVLVVFAGLGAGVFAGSARAEPTPQPPHAGLNAGCGFVDVVMLTYSPDSHLFELFDNGKRVLSRPVMGDDQTNAPAQEGHTYRLTHEGDLVQQIVYHRPPVCDSARLTAKVSSDPSCEPQQRRVRVHNDGAAPVRVDTAGFYGQYTDFAEVAAGADHDFVGTWGPYLVVDTPDGPVPYSVLPRPGPTGCGVFTSRLTALCGGQVRWDVGTEAIGPQSLAVFREFGPVPKTPVPVWLGTLPAHGKLTVYAPVVGGDVVMATHGGLRPGTQDPYVDEVLSQIDEYREPAACARPEQAAVTFKAGCDGPTATITNYGPEREFTVSADGTPVKTVKLARGGVATVKIRATAAATVAVTGEEAFVTYVQRACPTPTATGGGGTGGGNEGGNGGNTGGGLPITGYPVAWVALGGTALLLAGLALTLAARRRRYHFK